VTVRSEGQFNTVVYEDEDVYRGIPQRDAILLNPQDMASWDITPGSRITVSTDTGSMSAVAFAFDVAPGNAAMYPPECNVLVPRIVDPKSRTPGFKGFVATLS
jgi:anaerobic selenocysteine-containing dehydrogenase